MISGPVLHVYFPFLVDSLVILGDAFADVAHALAQFLWLDHFHVLAPTQNPTEKFREVG